MDDNTQTIELKHTDGRTLFKFDGNDIGEALFQASRQGVNLQGLSLDHVVIRNSRFRGSLSGSSIRFTQFINCDFRWVDFSNCQMPGCYFIDVNMYASVARSTDFQMCLFSGCVLTDSQFTKCYFAGVRFDSATKAERSDFSQSNFDNSTFDGTLLTEANFTNTDLTSTDFSKSRLWSADLTGAKFNETKFEGSRIEGLIMDPHIPEWPEIRMAGVLKEPNLETPAKIQAKMETFYAQMLEEKIVAGLSREMALSVISQQRKNDQKLRRSSDVEKAYRENSDRY